VKNRICVILFAIVLSTSNLFAGAWPQKKGSGFFNLSLRAIRATEFYEKDGNKIGIPTLGDYTTTFYTEYGVTDRLTAILNVPLLKRITLNKQVGRDSDFVFFEGDSKTGIADSDIGLRFSLLKKSNSVVSAELLLGLPIGDNKQENGLFTGDGEFNQLLKLQFGYSFYPKKIYFTGDIGFNNRTKGYSDEWHYSAEIGLSIVGNLSAALKLRGVESRKNGADSDLGGTGGLFANNQRYLSFGPEFNYSVSESLGFTLGIESATRTQSVVSAPAFSFGVFLKR